MYKARQPLLGGSFQYRQQDPDYYGEPLEAEYQNGPVSQRSCRDIFCLIFFLAFLGLMGYIAYLGFSQGNPLLLTSPFDSDGQQCGRNRNGSDYTDYPNIYASFLILNPTQIYYVCVKQCPNNQTQTLDCKTVQNLSVCSDLDLYETNEVVTVCLPAAINTQTQKIADTLKIGSITQGFSDLEKTWKLTLACFGITFVVALLVTLFIRCCVGCVVWTVISIFMIFLAALATLCFLIEKSPTLQDIFHFKDLPVNLQNGDFLFGLGAASIVLFVVFVLVICCSYKQIRISIGLLKAAADFVREQCSIYFVPLFMLIFKTLFIAFWVSVVLFLFSSGEIKQYNSTPFGWVDWNTTTRNYIIVYLFGLVWGLMFLTGFGKFIQSSSVAIWYFEEGNPDRPLLRSVGFGFMATGSIALGSFLLTTVVWARIILNIINYYFKSKTLGGQLNAVTQCMVKCASCMISCFQRFVRFITSNAYVMMAVSGKGFFDSATEAFYLIARSAHQYSISHGTVQVFMWIGKIFITCLSTVICYIILTESDYKYKIFSPLFPVLSYLIISFSIATTFMNFFGIAADALLLCYCMEKDLSVGRNKCPPALRNFLEEYVSESVYSRGQ